MSPLQKIILVAVCAILYRSGRNYISGCICTQEGRLEGKTALVLAADTDIGLATVRGLARRGARVVMACQVVERCNTARKQLIQDFSHQKSGSTSTWKIAESKLREDAMKTVSSIKAEQIYVRSLHLASAHSIQQFAEKFIQEFKSLNILIVNAVHLSVKQDITVDGFERNLGMNFVSSYLITQHLLPLMQSSAKPAFLSRLIFVSHRAHQLGELPKSLPIKTVDFEYSWWRAFASSQLALVTYANHLTTRVVNPAKVRIATVHPGFENEKFGAMIMEPFAYLLTWFGKTPWQAAQPAIAATLMSPKEAGVYFEDCVSTSPNPTSFNPQAAARLIAETNAKLAPFLPQKADNFLKPAKSSIPKSAADVKSPSSSPPPPSSSKPRSSSSSTASTTSSSTPRQPAPSKTAQTKKNSPAKTSTSSPKPATK